MIDALAGSARLVAPGRVARYAWSSSGAHLAFLVQENGNVYSLYIANGDGSGLHQVVQAKFYQAQLAWAGLGDQLFFAVTNGSSDTIDAVDAAGGAPRTFYRAGGIVQGLATSRDGRWVGFVDGNSLYQANPDGSGARLLDSQAFGNVLFSPDSQRLAYVSLTPSGFTFTTLGVDGTAREAFSDTESPGRVLGWTADSGWLALYRVHSNGRPEVAAARPDGSGLHVLDAPSATVDFAPSGSRLVLDADFGSPDARTVHVLDAAGGTGPRLAVDGAYAMWSATNLVAIVHLDGAVTVQAPDGSGCRQVAALASNTHPAFWTDWASRWSPDGRSLLVSVLSS